MKTWIKLAVRRDVVVRSLKIAVVVGSVLAVTGYFSFAPLGTSVVCVFFWLPGLPGRRVEQFDGLTAGG